MGMKWTVTERPAMCDGLPVLTVFEIRESDDRAMLAGMQSSEHCPGYGWTAAELRERAQLMAAAPATTTSIDSQRLRLTGSWSRVAAMIAPKTTEVSRSAATKEVGATVVAQIEIA